MAAQPGEPSEPAARLALAVATTILLIPVVLVRVPWAEPGGSGDFNRRVTLQPFDLGVLATALLAIPVVARSRPRWSWRAAPAAALGGWYVVAALVHPNWRGLELLLRLAVLALVALAAPSFDREQRNGILAVAVLVAALQAVLSLAQAAKGEVLGLGPLEFSGFLYPFGDDVAGRGGLTHPYHLAVLLVIGIGAALADDDPAHRRLLVGAGGVIGLGLASTFSRAGVLALVLALVAAAVSMRRRTLRPADALPLGAAVVGLAIGIALFSSGWLARAETTSGGNGSVDSGRRQFLADAGELIADHPLAGVGPGRYVTALDDAFPDLDVGRRLPPHDVVAHVAAEAGVPAAALLLVAGAQLLRRAWRRRPAALLVVALLLPYFLLDAYPYSFPAGLAMLAVPAVVLAGEGERR